MGIYQAGQPSKRGVTILAAVIYLLIVKAEVIMLGSSLNSIILWSICLYNDFTCFESTPGSACHLTQELKGALHGTKIGEIETSISANYPG
jgi:hypothetical protein